MPAFILHCLALKARHPLLCIVPDADTARYLYSDLRQFSHNTPQPLLFPAGRKSPYDQELIADSTPLVHRADILQQLEEDDHKLLITCVDAIIERVPTPSTTREETLSVTVGVNIDPEQLVERLVARHFERVEFVERPGELAWRGGIIDVYPFSGDYPIRMEFFGTEIESLREFDARTQRSVSHLDTARLVPNLTHHSNTGQTFTSLFQYLPANTIVVTFDGAQFESLADTHFSHVTTLYTESGATGIAPAQWYLKGEELSQHLSQYSRLYMGAFCEPHTGTTLTLPARPQPVFNSRLEPLRTQIVQNKKEGIDTFILCDSKDQKLRLADLLEDYRVGFLITSLHKGFEFPDLNLAVYTDHEIFCRYHRPTINRNKRRGGMPLRELRSLQPGDFVVHTDYGIGRFTGFQKITVRNKQQEALRIHYAGDDVLYVNVNALSKLHKYKGKDGHTPRLTKLGSGQWERAKARTKKRIKVIARDLILLYAHRKAIKGFRYSPDTIWQREMEASFAFEDTPDQAIATQMVKQDMEDTAPMDRLICGDVGFGKTEIAIRAAFKAVQEGRQVAILVPTTVLARQHYETLRKRLARFPVHIEMLSRFRKPSEIKHTIADLKRGSVDIVVGTHRLVSKDVAFKELGLLIVDEEQRFGVGVKERLRQMRVNVDTLTLTATPIPRTLQFSLMGARDLSIINTPPPNRQPIVTEIHSFNKNLIRDAILYETSRGGQVFFIHNRVHSIDSISAMLRELVPGIRIQVAHGQMKAAQLEGVMMKFVDRTFDVLVATTIIENGLDIANANTIIINQAHHYGLAELHQLRGRVGRSNRKAFCYLLVPSVHALTRQAQQRLRAVEELSNLGSGFQIAMRDLDIRGAGNILGGEQSGFIAEVGYETYHRILDEAVQELRTEEFRELFGNTPVNLRIEASVDVSVDAFIPDSYVANHLERLSLYRRISETGTIPELHMLRAEMKDRFGTLPEEADHLLCAAEMKIHAHQLRLPRVLFRNQRLFLQLPEQNADPEFYEQRFPALLNHLGELGQHYVLKESKQKKLRAIIQKVTTLEAARSILENLVQDQALASPSPCRNTISEAAL